MRRWLVVLLTAGSLLWVPSLAQAHHRPGPCNVHWVKAWREHRDTRPIVRIIYCAVARWPVPGGITKALDVANRESGYRPDADNPYSDASGVYQHRLHLWPPRYRDWTLRGWRLYPNVFNGRTNVIVTIRMVHAHGWGPWGG